MNFLHLGHFVTLGRFVAGMFCKWNVKPRDVL